jgi:hypothetical protein
MTETQVTKNMTSYKSFEGPSSFPRDLHELALKVWNKEILIMIIHQLKTI